MQDGTMKKPVYYENGISEVPDHFEILSEVDQFKYKALQRELVQLCIQRSKKNRKVQDLEEFVQRIHDFCIQGDEINDKKRCFICGIYWIDSGICNTIALNIDYLQILVRKCRSSLNTTFRTMGYKVTEARCDANTFFKQIIPDIQLSRHEERLWSFRTNSKACDILKVKNAVNSFRNSQKLRRKAKIQRVPSNEKEEPPFLFDNVLTTLGKNEIDPKNFFDNFFNEQENQFSQYFFKDYNI